MKKVVLLSGGIDSTTCLAQAVQVCGAENVTALCVFYGQKHSREMAAARKVAAYTVSQWPFDQRCCRYFHFIGS